MTVTSITTITDHVERAIARLPQQYKDAPEELSNTNFSPDPINSWQGLLFALVNPAQTLENTMTSMLASRGLLTAEGINLDRLGEIVGASRNGLDDAAYLLRIYIQIAANNSDGTGDNIIEIWEQIITAADIGLFEVWPAKFRLYLKLPDLDTNYALVRAATEAAKAAGVGFLPILISPYTPIFAFESDPDTDTAGFGVIQEVVDSPYSDYDFADNGAITDTTRISVSSSISGPQPDYIMTFHLDSTAGPLFETELTTEMAIDGGIIQMKDAAGTYFKLTSDSNAVVGGALFGDSYRVTLQFITEGVIHGSLQFAGVTASGEEVLDGFQSYTETDEATFDAENPDGIAKTLSALVDLTVLDYYTEYTFPANYPGGGFSRVFSANRFSFPARYELRVVTNLGDEADEFEAQLSGEGVGWSVVDSGGVLWQYVGTFTYTRQPVFDFPDDVAEDFLIEITKDDGSGDELGVIYKDGIATTYDDFYFNFGTISKTDEAGYDTNNPDGFGNAVSASTSTGGGFYSILAE